MPEDGHAEVEDGRIGQWGVLLIDAARAPGKDKAGRFSPPYLLDRGVIRDQFRVDPAFAHAPGDKLGVLAAKIQH